MEFLITESQLQVILREQNDTDNLTESVKRMNAFTNNMVNKVLKNYELNLKMLSTWGASVGGLVMPLNEFIKTGNFNISESERYLVLCGVAFLLLFEGKRGMSKVLNKIKEEGLGDVFDATLSKGIQLRDSFANLLKSLKIVSSQFLEIISYTFLLPIFTDIHEIAMGTTDVKEVATTIALRLAATGAVLLSKESLIQILRKIIRKLQ